MRSELAERRDRLKASKRKFRVFRSQRALFLFWEILVIGLSGLGLWATWSDELTVRLVFWAGLALGLLGAAKTVRTWINDGRRHKRTIELLEETTK